MVKQVSVALDAAFADGRKFDSALLVGPPGVGKSALATVIAAEMATNFHEVLGQSIKTPADLNALLLNAKDKSVLHIDECHEMKKEFQTSLYMALDQRKIIVHGGCGAAPYGIPIADCSLLLSSTDEHSILQPLRDRCKIVLRFEFYSVDELTIVAAQRAKGLGWDVEESVFPQIAHRAVGLLGLPCGCFKPAIGCAVAKVSRPLPRIIFNWPVTWRELTISASAPRKGNI